MCPGHEITPIRVPPGDNPARLSVPKTTTTSDESRGTESSAFRPCVSSLGAEFMQHHMEYGPLQTVRIHKMLQVALGKCELDMVKERIFL